MLRKLKGLKNLRVPSEERDIEAEIGGMNKSNLGKTSCGRRKGSMA